MCRGSRLYQGGTEVGAGSAVMHGGSPGSRGPVGVAGDRPRPAGPPGSLRTAGSPRSKRQVRLCCAVREYGRCVLVGREPERARLASLIEQARHGSAGILVLRGEPGVGKSALLDAVVADIHEATVLRTQGLEIEAPLAFAALHRLLRPVLRLRDGIPAPQARALRVAFGEEEGPAVEPFLVGVATLSMLAAAAEESLVVCVVDDAHWLDPASAAALLFCARRLGADRVSMIFAARDVTRGAVRRARSSRAGAARPRPRRRLCTPRRAARGRTPGRRHRTTHRGDPWESAGPAGAAGRALTRPVARLLCTAGPTAPHQPRGTGVLGPQPSAPRTRAVDAVARSLRRHRRLGRPAPGSRHAGLGGRGLSSSPDLRSAERRS